MFKPEDFKNQDGEQASPATAADIANRKISAVNVDELHSRCSQMTSDDLIQIILLISMNGKLPCETMTIMKTYLYRALYKEGIR